MIRAALILFAFAFNASALEPQLASRGKLIFAHDFAKGLPQKWTAQFGDWKAVDGVLRARQIPADNHGAAARRVLEMQDGVFELRFRFTGGKGFHFGFDPKRGTLKKKGHLFSVIVSPAMAKIMKHVDKSKPKEDPNEDLAKVATKFPAGQWNTLLLEKVGNRVTAQIQPPKGKAILLRAEHPTFHVPTPTLVFRCIGDGIEVDDIKVWQVAR